MAAAEILLDTNLAVLLAVGAASPDYIAKHKRLDAYDSNAFEVLDQFLGTSDGIAWCPHVLAETSNLVRYIAEPARTHACRALAMLVDRFPERSATSASGCAQPEYLRLGLTDAMLAKLTEDGTTLLTDDLRLHQTVIANGRRSILFAELIEPD